MKETILVYCREHKGELALVMISCGCTLVALCVLYISFRGKNEPIRVTQTHDASQIVPRPKPPGNATIYVDISGAVENPGMVQLREGDRLSDALEKVGGLSARADTDYFARNYNIARIVVDQEKLYVPRVDEVTQGIFVEGRYLVNHSLERVEEPSEAVDSESHVPAESESGKIDINNASAEELDTLPGVGPATAQKIIDQRPYTHIDELLEKKSVGQSVFDKLKNLISTG